MFNCLSSIPIFLLGMHGFVLGLRHGYHMRFLVAFVCLAFVGLGSVAFHGTLLFAGQAMDELPMIYCTVALIYTLLEPQPKLQHGPWLVVGAVVYCLLFTLAYFFVPQLFVFFIWTYFFMTLGLFVTALANHNRVRNRGGRLLMRFSLAIYLFGFCVCWIPDKFFCHAVQSWHLHALFHVCAGMGGYSLSQHFVFACILPLFIYVSSSDIWVMGRCGLIENSLHAQSSSNFVGVVLVCACVCVCVHGLLL
jgi:dihydroceramidase